MNDILKYATLAASLLPLVREIVQMIEIFPNLTGVQKKDYALNMLEMIFNSIKNNPDIKINEIKDIDFSLIKSIASPLIDIVVSLFNASGVFKKST